VERFIDYRSRCGKPADTAFRRVMARAWNANVGAIAGWPDIKLVELAVKSTVEIPWSDFPEGLRQHIDRYLAPPETRLCARRLQSIGCILKKL
jgi:hypothetical protein